MNLSRLFAPIALESAIALTGITGSALADTTLRIGVTPVPPAEAVRLLDWFLTERAARGLPVFAVSGNHDSADRIAFGARRLAGSRVYVSPVFAAPPAPITQTDENGPEDIWLLHY